MKLFYLRFLLIPLLICLINVKSFAWDAYDNGIYYLLNKTERTAEVVRSSKYSYYEGAIDIPSTFQYLGNTYSVTSIGDRAFAGNTDLISIRIPKTVTNISKTAFEGQLGLVSITIDEGNPIYDSRNNCNAIIETKSNKLLRGCQNTTIPNGITCIGEKAFYYCNGLTEIIIPNSVVDIESEAFYGCHNLTSVNLPNNLVRLGYSAFEDCLSLASINLPNSLVSIGSYALNTNALMHIYSEIEEPFAVEQNAFPGTSKYGFDSEGNWTFQNSNSTTILHVPFGTTEKYRATEGWNIFENIVEPKKGDIFTDVTAEGVELKFQIISPKDKTCSVYRAVGNISGHLTIPDSAKGYKVTEIGSEAFIDCTSLTSVDLGTSVTNIDYNAFYGCIGLASILIPKSVISIDNGSFRNCPGLESIVVENGNPIYDSRGNCNAIIETASNTLIVGCKNTVIPNTVETLANESFEYCTALTSITIPNSVTDIQGYVHEGAFFGCDSLKYIRSLIKEPFAISKDVFSENVYKDAMLIVPMGCKGKYLTKDGWKYFQNIVEFGSGYVFTAPLAEGADMIFQIINLEEGTCSVGDNSHVAIDPSYAGGITVPSVVTDPVVGESFTVVRIGNNAFSGCGSLTSIGIPDGLTEVGNAAFTGCNGLQKPVYNASIFFFMPTNYEGEYRIPAGIKEIHEGAFQNCNGLAAVTISNSVASIGNYAFAGTSLKDVTIPNSVKSIGDYAFYECQEMASVTIPNSVKSIGNFAFGNCIGLYSVTSLITVPFTLNENVFQCTGDYEADIMYYIAKLFVPIGRSEVYSRISGWKEFQSIAETDARFKLTYMLDGEVYKSYDIQATEVITPEPDPYKEGYIFSGWSNLPYLMPAEDVTVTGSFTVDPNWKFQLTYILDGEVYKSYDLRPGEKITPEADPVMDGYTFSGWSDIPDVMPAENVTITGTLTPISDSVYAITNNKTAPHGIYSVEGHHQTKAKCGLNIILMSDGSTRKVMVK